MSYSAPVKDMLFDLEHIARIDQIAQLPGFEDATLETAQAAKAAPMERMRTAQTAMDQTPVPQLIRPLFEPFLCHHAQRCWFRSPWRSPHHEWFGR